MKTKIAFFILSTILVFSSCEYDNYDAPSTTLNGRVVYNGRSIHLGYNEVAFQLWENPPKFGGNTAISVPLGQDGSYSNILFNGDYKLIFVKGQGPFMMKPNAETKDTIFFSLNGSKTMDIEVLPYYMFNGDVQYAYDKSSGNMDVTVKLEKIITDANQKNVEYVRVLYNATQFVGNTADYYLGYKTVSGPADINNIKINLQPKERPKQNPNQDYLYFRVGVKLQNVEDLLYSPVQKIQL